MTRHSMQRKKYSLKAYHALVIALFCLVPSAFSYAQPVPAPSPCDVTYFNSLKARAWLESQREITQNQNLIFKPDSVLEYTCFDKYLSELAGDATSLFSENSRWSPPTPSPTRMDNALRSVVGNALTQYINGNFNHNFLNGRSSLNYTPGNISSSTGYSCDRMNEVWKVAKCLNFIADPATDGFYTFAEYAGIADRRRLPTACGNVPEWTTNISTATGPATLWPKDPVNSFLGDLDPGNCGSATNPIRPIATGVMVRRPKQTPAQYEEKICAAPGCYYVPTSQNSGTCRNL